MRYTCVDAFAGAGGLGLGLQSAGFDVLLAFDNDPKAVQTQRSNPEHFRHRVELASVDEMLGGVLLRKVRMEKGELFLLAGGPPCQGFSIQRIGEDDDLRNDLVLKFMSLVGETSPKYFLMENVPGIAGKRGRSVLKAALEMATSLGYWTHQATLDAQDFGVPQRRRRVFVVGEKMDGLLPTFSFPAAATPEGRRVTVREAIGDLPPPPEDGTDHPQFPLHRRDRLSETNKRRLMALNAGEGRDQLPEELLAECHRVDSSVIGHRHVYGRMEWDQPAPTITARFDSFTRGQFGHPEQIRSISLREGALLQTFPKNFRFVGNKVDVARQIGNAVPPRLAQAIGEPIIASYRLKNYEQDGQNEF
jgi:DNA (cytosine-5)-methyltransferase 1